MPTNDELANDSRDALVAARAALLARFRASTDSGERAQITSAVDAINSQLDELDFSDLLSAATAVGEVADELEGVVAAVKTQPIGSALQDLLGAFAKLDSVRAEIHEVDALPKTPDPATLPAAPPPAGPAPGGVPAINPAFQNFTALKAEYDAYFAACAARSERLANINYYVKSIVSKKAMYSDVVGALGIPWFFVGIIHGMECGFSLTSHLHNGDPLSARTVHVPAGRPVTGDPPFSWRESAIDALTFEGFDKESDWSVAHMLYLFEKYNGMGYRKRGLPSPYLWSFSNLYVSGRYVADRQFDPDAVSKQAGAGVILKSGKAGGAF